MRPTFLQLVRHGERARLKDPDERRVVDAESVAQRKNGAHGDRRGSHPGVDRKLDAAALGPVPTWSTDEPRSSRTGPALARASSVPAASQTICPVERARASRDWCIEVGDTVITRQAGQGAGAPWPYCARLHPDGIFVQPVDGVRHDLRDRITVTEHRDDDGRAGDRTAHHAHCCDPASAIRHRTGPVLGTVPQHHLVATISEPRCHRGAQRACSENSDGGSVSHGETLIHIPLPMFHRQAEYFLGQERGVSRAARSSTSWGARRIVTAPFGPGTGNGSLATASRGPSATMEA